MNTTEISNHIQLELVKLEKVASDHVKRLAMQVLKSNSRKCFEFVMCMGTFFFTNKKQEPMWQHELEELKGYTELTDFIYEWDSILHITGEAVRFDKKGIEHYDW